MQRQVHGHRNQSVIRFDSVPWPPFLSLSLLIMLTSLAINWLLRRAAASKARHEGTAVMFAPEGTVRLLLSLWIAGFAAWAVYASVSEPGSVLVPAVFGGLAVVGVIVFHLPSCSQRRASLEDNGGEALCL